MLLPFYCPHFSPVVLLPTYSPCYSPIMPATLLQWPLLSWSHGAAAIRGPTPPSWLPAGPTPATSVTTGEQGFVTSSTPRHRHRKQLPGISYSLHCTTLHCTALHYTTLKCTALHYTTLHCAALHCTALHCTALYSTAMYCTALYSTALLCTLQCLTV